MNYQLFPLLANSGKSLIPEVGFEPTRPQRTLDFESSASASSATPAKQNMMDNRMEKAVIGFEPTMKVLQTSALPLGYTARTITL